MNMLNILYDVAFWFFSVFFMLGGLGGFLDGQWFCALVIFVTGVVICPLFEKAMRKNYPNYPKWASLALMLVGFFAFGYWGYQFGLF